MWVISGPLPRIGSKLKSHAAPLHLAIHAKSRGQAGTLLVGDGAALENRLSRAAGHSNT